MAQWTRRREDIGGLHLTVRELASDGPALFLLHGLGGSGAVWQGVGRLLHPTLRLVAPDLRGHGESDKPSAGYLARDYVGDIAALVGQEPAQPIALLGHSLGAIVATHLAAERPELVGKLVLVDPPFDPVRPRRHIEAVERLRHEPRGELERYLQEREPGTGDLYARALADLFRAASDGAFGAALRAEPGYPMTAEALRTVRAATLVIAADPKLDAALGEEAARALVEAIPHGALIQIPGARHAIFASHPREFAQAVLGFLRDDRPRPDEVGSRGV